MCRHVAYLGPQVVLRTFLFEVPHGLVEQAAAPTLQTTTPTNPDGWGVAWYAAGRARPHQYRTVVPVWDDTRFLPDHGAKLTGALVAAVRSASPGSRIDVRNNAPFVHDELVFSLNGFVAGFRDGVGEALRSELRADRTRELEGDSDSEVLLALTLDRLAHGDSLVSAVASVATSVHDRAGGRLNLLLTDGCQLVATALGNSLFVSNRPDATVVASEPLDALPGWNAVPDGSIVEATAGHHDVRPL